MTENISRRDFLKLATVGAATTAMFTACGGRNVFEEDKTEEGLRMFEPFYKKTTALFEKFGPKILDSVPNLFRNAYMEYNLALHNEVKLKDFNPIYWGENSKYLIEDSKTHVDYLTRNLSIEPLDHKKFPDWYKKPDKKSVAQKIKTFFETFPILAIPINKLIITEDGG